MYNFDTYNNCKIKAGRNLSIKDELSKYECSKFYVLSDENLFMRSAKIKNILEDFSCEYYLMPSGEEAKNISNYAEIVEHMCDRLDRNSILINIGGGVVSDMGGFVASTLFRGIRYVNIPTTLMGMVDAAIGSKNSLDLKNRKNIVGTFYDPSAVLIDMDFLSTLEDKEYKNGFAEIIKYAFISDEISIDDLYNLKIDEIIIRCIKIKLDIVSKDKYDRGVRKILNFGHSFGHAVEAGSKYKVKHGFAVMEGMRLALEFGLNYNIGTKDLLDEFMKIKKDFNYDENFYGIDIKAIYSDKKKHDKYMDFVFLEDKSKAVIKKVPIEDLERWYIESSKNL